MNKTITNETVLTFGKHKGKTIYWVCENHPSYIVWLSENNVLDIPTEIVEGAIFNDMNNNPPEDYFWQSD